jgi:hypothetical protein
MGHGDRAVILAAVLLGIALIVGEPVLIIVAVAVAVVAGLAMVVLPCRAGQPISFSEEFPANTIGPRATTDGDSTPPVNTRRHPDPAPRAGTLEVATPDVLEPPDDERVYPQHVNLPPEDRLRREHGRTYVEKRPTVAVEDEGEES